MSWRAARWRRTRRARAALLRALLRQQIRAELLAELRAQQQARTVMRRNAQLAGRQAEPVPDFFSPR